MTADELVEKVARELCAIMGDDPDDVTVDSNTGEPVTNWTIYASDARAAIAIVVEACATAVVDKATQIGRQECCGVGVSDGYWPPECCGNPLYTLSDVDAAYAIRSLSPSSGSMGGE